METTGLWETASGGSESSQVVGQVLPPDALCPHVVPGPQRPPLEISSSAILQQNSMKLVPSQNRKIPYLRLSTKSKFRDP